MASTNKTLSEKLNPSQSYTSLIIGIIVVVIVAVVVVGLIRRGTGIIPTITPPAEELESQFTQEETVPPTTYNVTEGDTLWSISEKFYKSGYNWVDLAKENNLANADVLYVGTALNIPKVEPRIVTQPSVEAMGAANSITGTNYTVVKGDTLWDVAVRAYGDGYKWVDLAKANSLVNPDLIEVDQVLTISR